MLKQRLAVKINEQVGGLLGKYKVMRLIEESDITYVYMVRGMGHE